MGGRVKEGRSCENLVHSWGTHVASRQLPCDLCQRALSLSLSTPITKVTTWSAESLFSLLAFSLSLFDTGPVNCRYAVTCSELVETPYLQTSPMGGADCHWYVKSNQMPPPCTTLHQFYITWSHLGRRFVPTMCYGGSLSRHTSQAATGGGRNHHFKSIKRRVSNLSLFTTFVNQVLRTGY